MIGLIQRNLLLYFKNKGRIFFSLLGSLIGFLLYLVFLQNTIKSGWSKVPQTTKLLDPWLISGVLSITAITTTLNSLFQMIHDRESYSINDLLLTDESYLNINIAYFVSSVIIGTVMQIITGIIMYLYFNFADDIAFPWDTSLKLFFTMLLSSFVWTSFSLLILSFVHKTEYVGMINALISACAGFFVGVYIPFGDMPKSAQDIIKCTPAPYNSTLFRKILMHHQLSKSFQHIPSTVFNNFQTHMGIHLKWMHILSSYTITITMFIFGILFLLLALPLFKIERITKKK